MALAITLSDIKTAWESFLFRLERAWERTERHVQQRTGSAAQSWLSVNSKLRRSDPLLQYLKQARNAETHAIASSVESYKVISIADRFGRPFTLDKITLSAEATTLVIDLESSDIGIDWSGRVEPTNPRLQPIIVRGKKYDPPTRHLGNRITSNHPVFIATLGINFYKGAYAALEPISA